MKYLIIENDPEWAAFYQEAGVDTIFIDMEIIGKQERQGHIDSVKSLHTVNDIKRVRKVISESELLVRIDPINLDSENQIEEVISAGADTIMLPYFKGPREVEQFLEFVGGRVNTVLLLETATAIVRLPEVLDLKDFDRIHIGLNDLSLSLELRFMFELMTSPYVDHIIEQLKQRSVPYGIGGVYPIGEGIIPGEMVLAEYTRVGASSTILSRPFSRIALQSPDYFLKSFRDLKDKEFEIRNRGEESLLQNKEQIQQILRQKQ